MKEAIIKLIETLPTLGLGAIFGMVIQFLLDSKKQKTQQGRELEKDIYFKLQEKAEGLLSQIYLLKRQAKEMLEQMKKGMDPLVLGISNKPILESIKELSSCRIYFSEETLVLWDKCVKPFVVISQLWALWAKGNQLNQNQMEAFTKALAELDLQTEIMVKAIKDELDKQRNRFV